ncbi:MAG TPA: hypothetical protein VEL76_32480 [Gemmataceae bacterium]|nr:hypothetical protein [Gemmataceae bacterium]
MPEFYGAREAAQEASRRLGRNVHAREIGDLIYQGKLPADRCAVIGGRRFVPSDLLPELCKLLQKPRRQKTT